MRILRACKNHQKPTFSPRSKILFSFSCLSALVLVNLLEISGTYRPLCAGQWMLLGWQNEETVLNTCKGKNTVIHYHSRG